MPKLRGLAAGFVLTLALGACSGGGGNGDPIGSAPPPTAPPAGSGDSGCTGSCATADSRLSTGEIQQIIAQAQFFSLFIR